MRRVGDDSEEACAASENLKTKAALALVHFWCLSGPTWAAPREAAAKPPRPSGRVCGKKVGASEATNAPKETLQPDITRLSQPPLVLREISRPAAQHPPEGRGGEGLRWPARQEQDGDGLGPSCREKSPELIYLYFSYYYYDDDCFHFFVGGGGGRLCELQRGPVGRRLLWPCHHEDPSSGAPQKG